MDKRPNSRRQNHHPASSNNDVSNYSQRHPTIEDWETAKGSLVWQAFKQEEVSKKPGASKCKGTFRGNRKTGSKAYGIEASHTRIENLRRVLSYDKRERSPKKTHACHFQVPLAALALQCCQHSSKLFPLTAPIQSLFLFEIWHTLVYETRWPEEGLRKQMAVVYL